MYNDFCIVTDIIKQEEMLEPAPYRKIHHKLINLNENWIYMIGGNSNKCAKYNINLNKWLIVRLNFCIVY